MTPYKRAHLARQLCILLAVGMLLLPTACSSKNSEPVGSVSEALASSAALVTGSPENIKEKITPPDELFALYAGAWEQSDFAAMYMFLSANAKNRVTEEEFVSRYSNIFSGIEAETISVQINKDTGTAYDLIDEETALLSFFLEMDTLAGPVQIDDYLVTFKKEEVGGKSAWKIDWNEKLIFPAMEAKDKVQARVLLPARGELRDRNGYGLALNGDLVTIGIAPGKFGAGKEESIAVMAELLDIKPEKIEQIYQTAKNPDWFYPVVTLPAENGDLAARLTELDGVLYQRGSGRVYPLAAAAGLLTGYIGPITAEELETRAELGYTAHDNLGKMGLEQVYEERLRGEKGGEITLVHGESGQLKDVIARKEARDGENITLALDMKTQLTLYQAMEGDAGAAAAIDPISGEILALVSTPSFDPNLFQTYVPDSVRQEWNDAEKSYFTNRFKAAYIPGSVFKLVTAAIGLKAATLDPAEALAIEGKYWQPDAGWGDYHVTRVKVLDKPVDLADAILYSDNIYFARQALRVGGGKFLHLAEDFGFGEKMPLDYPFSVSQLANQDLANPILLADTAYGQGEVLLSPLHLALIYGTLATEGDLMKPVLELDGTGPAVWKSQAISKDHVTLLADLFTRVVEDPAGTGYTDPPTRTRMLGKTGTAELKKNQDDETAEENGWFVAMNKDQPRLAIAMVIEDVKERRGSRYVVPLVKQAMDDLLTG